MKKNDIIKTAFFSYQIIKQLGQGGSGTVYQVKRSEDEEQFALKILTAKTFCTEKGKRFKNEYCFLSSHSHENVLRPIDSGCTTGNCPFYVMPLATETLRDVINSNNRSGAERFELASGLLKGLAFLHGNGLIHRDIKPENILIIDDRPVIADIGIAHFEEDLLYTDIQTSTRTRLANFQYAAPEQRVKVESPTKAMDIYSMALVVHELFTGEFIQGQGRIKIASIFSEYGYFDPIIEKALANDPTTRIPDAKTFIQLLDDSKYNIICPIHDLRSETTHFYLDRFCVAFPEVETSKHKCFAENGIILKRLEQLLRPPYELGNLPCVWWSHGSYDGEVQSFAIDENNGIAYIGYFECNITKMVAFNSSCDYEPFVYLEVAGMPSLLHTSDVAMQIIKNARTTKITESLYYYGSRLISQSEAENGGFYDDDNNYIEIDSEKYTHHERFLAPWNILLLSRQNSFIQTGDLRLLQRMLDDILMGKMEIEELGEYVTTLAKPPFC